MSLVLSATDSWVAASVRIWSLPLTRFGSSTLRVRQASPAVGSCSHRRGFTSSRMACARLPHLLRLGGLRGARACLCHVSARTKTCGFAEPYPPLGFIFSTTPAEGPASYVTRGAASGGVRGGWGRWCQASLWGGAARGAAKPRVGGASTCVTGWSTIILLFNQEPTSRGGQGARRTI